MTARIEALQHSFAERIAGEVAQLATDHTLTRGFVSRVEMAAATFAKHGARLLANHPIQRLDLKPVNTQALARLGRAEALRGLRVLQLAQIIGRTRPMPFDELCASAFFDALEHFEVWNWMIAGDPEAAFARLRAPRLTRMRLYQVEGAPRILAGLAQNPGVRLHHLDVDLHQHERWPAVFREVGFEQLRSLELAIPGSDASNLLDHAQLPALVSLELDALSFDRLNLPTLQRLTIGAAELDAKSFARLLDRLPRLQALRIWQAHELDLDRALDLVLALPSDHPLRVLSLPNPTPDQAARLATRFTQRG